MLQLHAPPFVVVVDAEIVLPLVGGETHGRHFRRESLRERRLARAWQAADENQASPSHTRDRLRPRAPSLGRKASRTLHGWLLQDGRQLVVLGVLLCWPVVAEQAVWLLTGRASHPVDLSASVAFVDPLPR